LPSALNASSDRGDFTPLTVEKNQQFALTKFVSRI
jgi:hypothetical protein